MSQQYVFAKLVSRTMSQSELAFELTDEINERLLRLEKMPVGVFEECASYLGEVSKRMQQLAEDVNDA